MGNSSCICEKHSAGGEREISRDVSLPTIKCSNDDPERIYILAPPGRLGVIFKGIAGVAGHSVFSMRDFSPLLTKLKPGDVIAQVDDLETASFDHDQIRSVLAERHISERHLTVMRPSPMRENGGFS